MSRIIQYEIFPYNSNSDLLQTSCVSDKQIIIPGRD